MVRSLCSSVINFEPARLPFLFLGLVSCFGSISVPLSTLVLASRNAGSMLRINITCLVLDAALAIGLVPVLGLWGAVVANATAQSLSIVLLVIVSVRRIGVDGRTISHACRPLVLGLGAAAAAVLCVYLVPLPIGAVLAVAFCAGVAVEVFGFRHRPGWRISASDAALVEAKFGLVDAPAIPVDGPHLLLCGRRWSSPDDSRSPHCSGLRSAMKSRTA